MYNHILIILGLLFFNACSQNISTAKVKTELKQVVKVPIKVPVKVKGKAVTEFIPEHIQRSRIEVVTHY